MQFGERTRIYFWNYKGGINILLCGPKMSRFNYVIQVVNIVTIALQVIHNLSYSVLLTSCVADFKSRYCITGGKSAETQHKIPKKLRHQIGKLSTDGVSTNPLSHTNPWEILLSKLHKTSGPGICKSFVKRAKYYTNNNNRGTFYSAQRYCCSFD